MARAGGNPNIAKSGFKKGDPRINRKGPPKKLPKLKDLMIELLGHSDPSKMDRSEIALITKALIKKAKKGSERAADILYDRAFGRVVQSMDIKTDLPTVVPPTINVYTGSAPPLASAEDKVITNELN